MVVPFYLLPTLYASSIFFILRPISPRTDPLSQVKTLESPLECKEIKPINPKRNQPWIFIGRTDAETEALILWPPNVKSQLIGKDPNAGKDWRQKEKGAAEGEMAREHHWLDEHDLSKLWEILKDREAWHAAVHRVSQTWLSDWTTTSECLV